MTPHFTLLGMRPLTQSLRPLRQAARLSSGSCSGRAPDAECPSCAPSPRPACRARPPATLRAVRVTCCAPQVARRPPCPPCQPARPRTCSDASLKTVTTSQLSPTTLACDISVSHTTQKGCPTDRPCGTERDRVARRKELADLARRRHYEYEVTCREKPVRFAPPALYRLYEERECALATDGRDYLMPCERPKSHVHCSADRMPPPPRFVEVAPDSACRTLSTAPLDPCAHRPRVLLEIDRSSATASTATPMSTSSSATCSSSAGGITSRNLKSLSRTRDTDEKHITSVKFTRDSSRCERISSPKTPLRCRRPNIVENLRARSPTPCADPNRGRRSMHTTANLLAIETKPTVFSRMEVDRLSRVLSEREQLLETGHGRVVGDARSSTVTAPALVPEPPSGRLELHVPLGVERVSVHVSLVGGVGKLDKKDFRSASTPQLASPVESTRYELMSKTEKCDSWLSLKNIQKKLSARGRRGEIPTSESKKNGTKLHEPSTGQQPCADPPVQVSKCPSKQTPPPKCPPVPKSSTPPNCPLEPKDIIAPKCPSSKCPKGPSRASKQAPVPNSVPADVPKKPGLCRFWMPLVLVATRVP